MRKDFRRFGLPAGMRSPAGGWSAARRDEAMKAHPLKRKGRNMTQGDPGRMIQIGMGFWPAKTLLSAVELDLFTVLGDKALTARQLQNALELHPRGVADFLDTLVALNVLARDGEGETAQYRNTEDAAHFLDRNSSAYIGGFLDMANTRLYRILGDLTEALKTGKPQRERKHGGAGECEKVN